MNFIKSILLSLVIVHALHALPTCMDNSWHLKQKFDNKEYHYVPDCLCPCNNQKADRNQCTKCLHYHEAKPWVVVKVSDKVHNSKKSYLLNQSPHTILQQLMVNRSHKTLKQNFK